VNYLHLTQFQKFGLPNHAANPYWIPLFTPNFFSQADAGDGRQSLRYNEFNLAIRHNIRTNEHYGYFVDWGFRWVELMQHLNGNFLNPDGFASTENLDIRSIVNAGGFTFGAGLEYTFWDCLTVRGRFGAALLQGSLAGSFDEVNTALGAVAHLSRHGNTLVPGLEGSLLVTYEPGVELPYMGHVLIMAGYEMKNYFQVISTQSFVDDVHEGSNRESRTNFGLAGYMAGVQFIWPIE